MYTVTFREMEKAALALLTADVEKKCEFSTYIGHLLSQPAVLKYMSSSECLEGKLPIDQAQCDHQAGWRNYSINEFKRPPKICSNHLTGDLFFYSDPDILLIFCSRAGIAAANTSQVQYFDGEERRDMYDEFCEQVVGVKNIGCFPFCETAQQLLVSYLSCQLLPLLFRLSKMRCRLNGMPSLNASTGRANLVHLSISGSRPSMRTLPAMKPGARA